MTVPAFGSGESEQHVDRGGLSGAIGAEERDDLAGIDLEGEVVDGGNRSEPLRQIAKVDSEHWVSWGEVSRRTLRRARCFRASVICVRLIRKTVEPLFARLGGRDDGMTDFSRMLARVLVR